MGARTSWSVIGATAAPPNQHVGGRGRGRAPSGRRARQSGGARPGRGEAGSGRGGGGGREQRAGRGGGQRAALGCPGAGEPPRDRLGEQVRGASRAGRGLRRPRPQGGGAPLVGEGRPCWGRGTTSAPSKGLPWGAGHDPSPHCGCPTPTGHAGGGASPLRMGCPGEASNPLQGPPQMDWLPPSIHGIQPPMSVGGGVLGRFTPPGQGRSEGTWWGLLICPYLALRGGRRNSGLPPPPHAVLGSLASFCCSRGARGLPYAVGRGSGEGSRWWVLPPPPWQSQCLPLPLLSSPPPRPPTKQARNSQSACSSPGSQHFFLGRSWRGLFSSWGGGDAGRDVSRPGWCLSVSRMKTRGSSSLPPLPGRACKF